MGTLQSHLISNPFEFLLVVASAPKVEHEVDAGEDEAGSADRDPEESADEDRK
jgi:hypothetical protein